MKKKTKELIKWIKATMTAYGEITVYTENWKKTLESAFEFLDSLPVIEARLCKGGYIQDRNGTPCHDGDKIINSSNKEEGVLYWSKLDFRFYFKKNDTLYYLTQNFVKAEDKKC